MNERIKQLADKAWKYADANSSSETHGLVYTERLAELVIKDCASICELNAKSYQHSFKPKRAKVAESTSAHCGYLIKRYFGIES